MAVTATAKEDAETATADPVRTEMKEVDRNAASKES
jgi:hypothetical protein